VTLREKIEGEIRERGPMPFSRYMEMCLYDPVLGYYSRHAEQFGKAGDFYTSSDVHAVFGRLLARQFDEMWRDLGSPERIEVMELGPGRGLFAQDLLDWSEKKFPEFFQALHYRLAESSPALRQRLQATLRGALAAGKASFVVEEPTPAAKAVPAADRRGTAEAVPFPVGSRPEFFSPGRKVSGASSILSDPLGKGTTSVVPESAPNDSALAAAVSLSRDPIIVFANEFFDALPVEILSPKGALRIRERDGRFEESWASASAEELEFLDRHSVHPEDRERVEVPLVAQRYMSQIAANLQRGFLIVIDYGYTRQEQLAGRHRGTVMAYRQHSASANPYEAPGEQDLTAHVNFTALAAAAQQKGMQVQPLLTQSQFLMGIGEENQFADAFEECGLPQERAKVALQLKHLVTPAGMGESFHVLVASKGVDAAKAAALSGSSFGKTRV
jgi:SAM-dependent MidA family methyltransferase